MIFPFELFYISLLFVFFSFSIILCFIGDAVIAIKYCLTILRRVTLDESTLGIRDISSIQTINELLDGVICWLQVDGINCCGVCFEVDGDIWCVWTNVIDDFCYSWYKVNGRCCEIDGFTLVIRSLV